MGKFTYAVMTVFAVEFALYLFGGETISQTTLFGILFNPTTILSNPLYSILILGTLTAFAASAIIPGNFFQINIYALYAGIIVVFIGFSLSLIHLYSFVYGELFPLLAQQFAQVITVLITAPLIIFYIMACLEWVRMNF